VQGDSIEIAETVEWSDSTQAYNVEASAVARVGNGHLFVWAERNSGAQRTQIRWTGLSVDPLRFAPGGPGVEFVLPDDLIDASGESLYNRPVVALEIGSDGALYSVAASDPEGTVASPDDGPFRSAASRSAM
jgi:hypothetical protein